MSKPNETVEDAYDNTIVDKRLKSPRFISEKKNLNPQTHTVTRIKQVDISSNARSGQTLLSARLS